MGDIIVLVAIVAYWLGCKYYSGGIDRSVIGADPAKATPARLYNDGVDFMR